MTYVRTYSGRQVVVVVVGRNVNWWLFLGAWSKLDEPWYVAIGDPLRAAYAEIMMRKFCERGMGADSRRRSGVESALRSQHRNGNMCLVSVSVLLGHAVCGTVGLQLAAVGLTERRERCAAVNVGYRLRERDEM